ncbi:Gp37-like protein [Rothia koreensis]|uniref:Gp37-like protein n=1 Tax=Rothia koreensis TaxID=592378 RepID=UPI003FCC30F2
MFVIGPDLAPAGRLVWLSAEIVVKLNGAGTFNVQVPGHHPVSERVVEGSRIYICDPEGLRFSGLVTTMEHSQTQDGVLNLNLSGVQDMGLLNYRITYPDPLNPVDRQQVDHYQDSGFAADVIGSLVLRNCGAAALPQRRWRGFCWDPEPGIGRQVTVQTRLETLLSVVSRTADSGGVAVDVCYEQDRRIHGRIRECIDRSRSVVFHQDTAALGAWTVSRTAPEATTFVLAGQGEGKNRMIRSYDIPVSDTWGYRIEAFKDQRDADDQKKLDEAGRKLVAKTGGSAAVTMTIKETNRVFGRDFFLGDTVTAVLRSVRFADRVQAAKVSWSENGREVKVTVGPDQARDNADPLWVRRVRPIIDAQRKLEAI